MSTRPGDLQALSYKSVELLKINPCYLREYAEYCRCYGWELLDTIPNCLRF